MVDYEQVRSQFGAMLSRVAASYAAPGADRDDLQQEVALALVQALPSFRGESSLRTYVLRIAHNCGVRRIARRRAANLPLEETDHASAAACPERHVAARQEVEQLAAAVRELPLGARQVLVLTLEGLAQREIAEVLGISENVVSVRLHRARQTLAGSLAAAASRQGVAHG